MVISVGRRPFADLLELGNADLATDESGYVPVDDFVEQVKGIYAVGDLINSPQLAHVAFAEAIMVIKDICGEVIRQ